MNKVTVVQMAMCCVAGIGVAALAGGIMGNDQISTDMLLNVYEATDAETAGVRARALLEPAGLTHRLLLAPCWGFNPRGLDKPVPEDHRREMFRAFTEGWCFQEMLSSVAMGAADHAGQTYMPDVLLEALEDHYRDEQLEALFLIARLLHLEEDTERLARKRRLLTLALWGADSREELLEKDVKEFAVVCEEEITKQREMLGQESPTKWIAVPRQTQPAN